MTSEESEQDAPEASSAANAVHVGSAEHASHLPIDFSAFVLSLAQTAMIDMGVAPDPEGGHLPPNLGAACQTIDILAMLAEKTAGNLDAEEARLLNGALYQLRMSFLELKQAASSPE